MGRFIIIVLDGFGIGAMPDVGRVRPQDMGADTCRHIFARCPDLYLPALEELGLVNVTGALPGGKMRPFKKAVCGCAHLMHDGADTFFGHQEIMGTHPQKPKGEAFCTRIDEAAKLLEQNGFSVREYRAGEGHILIVNESATVADNIECDAGQAINVTAALDRIDFETVLKIGTLVRKVTTVPRVIAFGGRRVGLSDLLSAIEINGKYIGVNAPASGVYKFDYHCVHLGYGIDPQVQIPSILGREKIPVYLFGKVADIVQNPFGVSVPMVNTELVLESTIKAIEKTPHGFFCTNVQETDLCGHREDAQEYAKILVTADRGIAEILKRLSKDDVMIVMADHGNDPQIGHSHHTREKVPLLIRSRKEETDVGVRATLSDVAATAADYFGVPPPENGTSFLNLIY